MTTRVRKWFTAFSFIVPAVGMMAVFIIYPAVKTLLQSFFDAEGNWVGLQNFVSLLTSYDTIDLSRFPTKGPPWGSLIHNAVWVVIHLPVTVTLGILLAVMLDNIKTGGFIKSVIFLGMVIPMVVGGVIIRFIFDENSGIVPLLMRALRVEALAKSWTAYPQTSLVALILGSILLWTGFSLTMHAAGLSTIPKDIYEAAEVDGAGAFHKFFFITLPMLKPVTSVVIAMTILWELKIFDIVYTATLGGPGGASMVLSLQMYLYGFRKLDFNMASAVATLLTFFTMGVGIWLMRNTMRGEKL